jgi:hypothetical protein
MKATGIEPVPVFWGGGFPPILRKTSCKYVRIRCAILLARTKIPSAKIALPLSASHFCAIFSAANDALLTQSEDNKVKNAKKGRRQAAMVQLPSPYAL